MYMLQKIAAVLQEETIIISYISQVGTEMTWKISKIRFRKSGSADVAWKLSSSGIQTTQMHLNSLYLCRNLSKQVMWPWLL